MKVQDKKKKVSVGFVSLGCPKNMVDSERMLAQIAQAGFPITEDKDNADVIVINTCGFIAPAKAEAIESIKQAIERKKKHHIKKVIVTGCLPQRIGKTLLKEVKGIDAIVGLEQRDKIADCIEECLNTDETVEFLSPVSRILYDDRTRFRITPRHRAYLRISEGCSRNCSFCTIPSIRGKSRSKPMNLIIEEARELVDSGAVELNIIAQDITAYGIDIGIKDALTKLLVKLARIPRLSWIRLLYLYPTGVNDLLIRTVSRISQIVNYFDIPLQHVNPQILKLMRRPHSKDRLYKLIETLREKIPDCKLRTTFIVGFPGETESRFNELLEFVKWAEFDQLGCFTYYREKGTASAEFPNQVPDKIKKQRQKELMLAQQEIAFAKNKALIGKELICLVDKVEKGKLGEGRYFGQAPEIDSVCIINNCTEVPGSFIDAKVIGTKNYDLICQQI